MAPNFTSNSTPNIPFIDSSKAVHVSSDTSIIPISNSSDSRSPSIHSSFIPHINQFNEHPMMAREKIGLSKPKALLAHVEPTPIKQALSHP